MDFFTPLNEGTTWIQAFPAQFHQPAGPPFYRSQLVIRVPGQGKLSLYQRPWPHLRARRLEGQSRLGEAKGRGSIRTLFRILRVRPQRSLVVSASLSRRKELRTTADSGFAARCKADLAARGSPTPTL